jgi:hypothetical protein
MKKIINAVACLLLVTFMVSCSDEDNDGTPPVTTDPALALNSESEVTQLLAGVTNNQTSITSIIDSYDCFNIAFPVEVMANGQLLTLESEADYTLIESIFNQSSTDNDSVSFVFPINVTYGNYQIVSVGSQATLNSMVADCAEQTIEDIQNCVSLNYPINILGYNDDFELTATTTVNSDMELFLILFNLGNSSYYGIQYPISFNGYDGTAVTVNSNAELLPALQAALAECSGNTCNTNNTLFQQTFTALSAEEDVEIQVSADAQVHEYTFSMSESGTICSIGYQGQYLPDPIEYLIEILDENGTALYSGTHNFSTTVTEYISIPPVSIAAGHNYTIRRTVASFTFTDELIGLMANRSQNMGPEPPLLPYTQGAVTIESARFYDVNNDDVQPDYYNVPFIDFVFKSN